MLLDYPAPAIFLFEEVNQNGSTKYNVVDGKQRLMTIFDFTKNIFPVSEKALLNDLRGKYFEELDKETKIKFWNYSFLVEYLPSADESIINNIFDRINRNVARLTAQELRHAKYYGLFISSAEELTDYLNELFKNSLPRIAQQSRKQMKDVELTAQLMLLIEEGPKGYNSEELDKAFSDRDAEWEQKETVSRIFVDTTSIINEVTEHDQTNTIKNSRFANQADFYSLFGAIALNRKENINTSIDIYMAKLIAFLSDIENDEIKGSHQNLETYYQHARVASNRTTARKERISILRNYINS